MIQKIKKVAAFLPVLLLLVPVVASATGMEDGLNFISGAFSHSGLSQAQDLPSLILLVINLLLFVAGIIADLFVIIGGFWYITAQGNDEQAEKGRKALVNAIIGVIIVVMAWVIINVIQNTVTGGGYS